MNPDPVRAGNPTASNIKPESQSETNAPANTRKTREFDPSIGKATQWQPGFCPNPTGRPKRKPITEAFEAIFSDDPEAAQAFVRQIMTSRSAMAHVMVLKEAGERLEGKVTQPVEHSVNQELLDRLDRALKASE